MSFTKPDLGINKRFPELRPAAQLHPDACLLALTGVTGSLLPRVATGQGSLLPCSPEASGRKKADLHSFHANLKIPCIFTVAFILYG